MPKVRGCYSKGHRPWEYQLGWLSLLERLDLAKTLRYDR